MVEDTQIVNERRISSLLEENINVEVLEREHRDRQKKTNQMFAYGGVGKRKYVIEESNWGASLEDRRSPDYEIGAQTGPDRDKLRDAAGKYWGYDKNGSDSTASVVYISKGSFANMSRHVPFHMWVSEPIYNPKPENLVGEKNPFFEVEQVIRLTADVRAFTDKNDNYRADNWFTLLGGLAGEEATGTSGIITEQVEYNYLAFDMQLPYNYRELDNLNIVGPQYAKIRPEYNFYIRGYEEMLRFGAGRNKSETIFPNLYALMLEKINEVSNSTFVQHLTLGNVIHSGDASVGASNKTKFDIKKHSGQYFDIYGRSFSKASDQTLDSLAKKFKNVIVPIENVALLKELSEKKELFPMFVDMEFSTDKMTEFAQMLSDTMLTNDFMRDMVKDVVSSTGFGTEVNNKFVEVTETSNVDVQPDGTSVVTKSVRTHSTGRRVWNILSWLKNSSLVDFDTGAANGPTERTANDILASQSSVFLDDGTLSFEENIDPQKKFFRSLLGVIFVGKLKTFLKNRTRTYDEIIEGLPCHTETVLYRVEKTLIDSTGDVSDTVQNFWFPNTNQIDILNLVDTQIKYGKRYAYKIYAYQLVVNTKYFYSQSTVWEKGASLVVTQRPEVLLIEQPIFADNHLIIDDPPVPPEVEIVPYFADGRKLLFNLKSAVGEYHLDPIALNDDDVAAHDEFRISQKVGGEDPIRFKSDDPVGQEGFFEIYRLETHPKSWSDFKPARLAIIANNPSHGLTEALAASSAEFIDIVSSNRKYYYTCRMIDAHGHVSNPSDIYEVELVNDEGSVYMRKRIVDFLPVEPKRPSKSMRRLLQIKPALEQTFLDETSLTDVESALQIKDVKMGGILQESPWGRKFKFRLISRKTGKKIDFNVDFKAAMERKSTLK